MKEEGKICYEAPAITVVEVKTEGGICQLSGNGSINNMGNPEEL